MNKTIEVSAFVDRIQVFDNRRQSEVFHSNILGCGINLNMRLIGVSKTFQFFYIMEGRREYTTHEEIDSLLKHYGVSQECLYK